VFACAGLLFEILATLSPFWLVEVTNTSVEFASINVAPKALPDPVAGVGNINDQSLVTTPSDKRTRDTEFTAPRAFRKPAEYKKPSLMVMSNGEVP
jgi:hypothetical protein